MDLRRSITGTAGAALLVAGLAIGSAAPANAACRGSMEADASGRLQTLTEISARTRWRSAVRERHSIAYARWGLAKDKTMRCRKVMPGRRWHCTARARPCNR